VAAYGAAELLSVTVHALRAGLTAADMTRVYHALIVQARVCRFVCLCVSVCVVCEWEKERERESVCVCVRTT